MALSKIDWIVLVPDHEGALSKRMANRPHVIPYTIRFLILASDVSFCRAHLAGLTTRVESGMWMMGGATVEEAPIGDEQKKFNGSCIVAQATTKEEVLQEMKKDVYAQNGVWNLEKVQIYPLMTAFRKEKL